MRGTLDRRRSSMVEDKNSVYDSHGMALGESDGVNE